MPNKKRRAFRQPNDSAGTLCDNVSSMNRAAAALRSSSYIVCDCEGTDLGSEGGSLSIISLAVLPTDADPNPPVFLIDAIALSDDKLQPIYDLLRSSDHKKIMYDARSDFSEFYHRHGVELDNVLDLQLADIGSRQRRQETQEARLARLPPYCGAEEIKNHRRLYTKVERLNGLGPCATEHGIVGPDEKGKSRFFPHNKWGERPLWRLHIKYAVKDIRLISRLFDHFTRNRYINEEKLRAQSARYMALRKDSLKQPGGGHPLLPLDIIAAPPITQGRRACLSCSRQLGLLCFPKTPRGQSTANCCYVCSAVMTHDAEVRAKQEAQREQQRRQAQEKQKQANTQRKQQQPSSADQSSMYRSPSRSESPFVITSADLARGLIIFGYNDESTPGGTYLRDMYDSD